MPTDIGRYGSDTSASETEGLMFPSTPIWDRGTKRRGLGARRSGATRSDAPAPERRDLEPTFESADIHARNSASSEEAMVAPIAAASRPVRRSSTAKPMMATGAVAALALAAGAGWFAMRDTAPEPVAPVAQVATAPGAPSPLMEPAPMETAPTESAPMRVAEAATPPAATGRPTPARRAAPAKVAASGAAERGVDASTTLPDGPQPYGALNPGAPTTGAEASAPAPTTSSPAASKPAVLEITPAAPAATPVP